MIDRNFCLYSVIEVCHRYSCCMLYTFDKMKHKVFKLLGILVLIGLVVNFLASRTAKHGLRALIDSPAVLNSNETYRFVGSSTRDALSQFKGEDYSITVLPFDWIEQDMKVTHTALIRSEGREVWVRLRLNPVGLPFDILGYTDRKSH